MASSTVPTSARNINRAESKKKLLSTIDPQYAIKPAVDYSKETIAERKRQAKRRVMQQQQKDAIST